MDSPTATPDLTSVKKIDLSAAGWFLMVAAVWELLFNRLSAALGLYGNVGAEGFMSTLASSGRLAMNAVGIMSLMLACIMLPRLARDPQFASLPARIVLMLVSPLYLPVVCVAAFRPVLSELVLVGYLVSSSSAAFIAILLALRNLRGGSGRLLLALAGSVFLGALELVLSGTSSIVSRKIYLLAEVLYTLTPVFAFIVLKPGRLSDFLKRPHLVGLSLAVVTTVIAAIIANYASNKTVLTMFLVAFRTLGITMGLPGGWSLYVVALFFGSWLVGSLTLPSGRWRPTVYSRRTGFGLTAIWIAGIQPVHPYQFVLVLLGFLYIARGLPGYLRLSS